MVSLVEIVYLCVYLMTDTVLKNKVVSAEQAIAIIQSGDIIASAGFIGTGTPDELINALETRFLQTNEPK